VTACRILSGASALAVGLFSAACGGGGGAGALSHDVPTVQLQLLDAASNSEPGELAARFLRDSTYDSIVIEVDYPAGRAPNLDALETLSARLGEVCRKPGGVTVVVDDAIPLGAFPEIEDAASLEALEEAWRDRYADESTGVAVFYVLCVPGGHVDDTPAESVLGMAFGGSSVALFLDSTDRVGDFFATTAEMRATILLHESCHILGLVNHGIPMVTPHEDPDHAHHCDSPNCLLSAAPVLPRLGPDITDPDFAPLCPHCVADLAAYASR
jgi:hypothetical protein